MGRLFKKARKQSVRKITVDKMIKYQINLKSNGLDLNIKNEYLELSNHQRFTFSTSKRE